MNKILSLLTITFSITSGNCTIVNDTSTHLTTAIKSDNEINFLATADIHAGYPESESISNKTISAISQQLPTNNNRGVIVAGDLTGYVRYPGNIFSYITMTAAITNHLLASFGNHDADISQKINQTWLNQNIVKHNAMAATHLLYYASKREVPVYSWNWSGIHFVQCSLAPIDYNTSTWNDGKSDPGPALTELETELEKNIGINSNMPIVLTFHYGYDDFSTSDWWSQEQRTKFENTILAKYNVILLLTGHLHFSPTTDNEQIIPVIVNKKIIYDVLPGTALYGGYAEISINKINKTITIKRHNAQQNDEIVINKIINY